MIIGFFENVNAHAEYINQTKYRDDKPFVIGEGFINFSLSNHYQANGYNEKILSDSVSKNHLSSNNTSIGNDSQIYLKSGINHKKYQKFGAIAKVEFNYSSENFSNNGVKQNPNLDQIFLFAENDFGKFELGNNQAVNQKMKYGPARFARGSGGINGKYLQYVNLPMLANSNSINSPLCDNLGSQSCSNIKLPRFITLAQSPIGHGGYAKSFYRRGVNNNFDINHRDYNAYSRSNFRAFKDDSYDGLEDATKISYYSPKINGFQIGLSYAPDSSQNGLSSNTALDLDYIRLKNIFAIGLNYIEDFDNLAVAFSATAEKAKYHQNNNNLFLNNSSIDPIKRNDLMAYDLGFALSYFGFKLGASWGNWNKSLQPKTGIYSCEYQLNIDISSQDCTENNKKFRNPYYYTLGLAYQISGLSASISSIKSNFQNNIFNAYSFGIDYKYSKNLLPYLEITKFAFKVDQPQASNIINQATLDNKSRQLKNNYGNIFLIGILYSF